MLAIGSILIASGVTLAYMFLKEQSAQNRFIPATVSCEAVESFDGSEKSSITVKNTGNIDAYLRVSLVSYWQNADGMIVGEPSDMPNISFDSSNWLKKGDIYYCLNPVKPTESAPELLTAPLVLKTKETSDREIIYQVVEVFAEAIQSKPTDAVTESWGVVVNNNGTVQEP